MCSDPVQQHCKAPRCDTTCKDASAEAHCSREDCSGCIFCAKAEAARKSRELQASPGPSRQLMVEDESAAAPKPTCDTAYLNGVNAELKAKVQAQQARNNELRSTLVGAADKAASAPATATPSPPLCALTGHQCGGSRWEGPTKCCQSNEVGAAARVCRWFDDSYSGCRDVSLG